MVKKSKKCLALTLSVATLVGYLGNFNVFAMKPSPAASAMSGSSKGSEWCNPLASETLKYLRTTGITKKDFEIPEVRMVFEVCERLRHPCLELLEPGEKEEVELLEEGKCKPLSELCDLHVKYSLDTGKGTEMTCIYRIIYEITEEIKRNGGHIEIYPLLLNLKNGSIDRVCIFMIGDRKYVIDPLLQMGDVPCIFTMQAYLEYRKIQIEEDAGREVKVLSMMVEDVRTCTKPIDRARTVFLDTNTGVEIPKPTAEIFMKMAETGLLEQLLGDLGF